MTTTKRLALTADQVREIVERLEGLRVSHNVLHVWCRHGLVTSSIQAGHAGGHAGEHRRLFSYGDTARVRLIARLRAKGVSLQKVRVIMARLDGELTRALVNPTTRVSLVVDGHHAMLVRPGEADEEVVTRQLRLPLREVTQGIREEAERMRRAAA